MKKTSFSNIFVARKSLRSLLLITMILMFLVGAFYWSLNKSAYASGTITGTIFNDYNANGTRDTTGVAPNFAIDPGVSGVIVTAYDSAGVNRGASLPSAANGTYSITATGTGPYRIEFTNLPAGYQPAPHGTNNNSTVQFVPDGISSNINLGITRATDYVQNDPELVTACYVFGAQNDPAVAMEKVLVSFPYSSGTTDTADVALPAFPTHYDNPTSHAMMIGAPVIGTTFGVTYARNNRRVYAAAYFKRHSGFGPGADGIFNNADDMNAIYRVDRATNTVSAVYSVPGATTNAHNTANYSTDNGNTGWEAVGKTSLGSLEISPDETTLYVMNLQNRTLYALNANTGAVITSQAVPTSGVPTPGGTATNAAAGDVRPFAVRYYQGSLYVGITCTGQSTGSINDLFAHVYSVNPTTLAFSASPVFTVRLNYPRGKANAAAGAVAEWQPWRATFTNLITDASAATRVVCSQPMFTDMAFDNGNLILGIRDRLGDQVGNNTQSNPASTELYQPRINSDMLRAAGNPTSGWTLESNGRSNGNGTAPQNTGQGPGSGANTPPGSGTTGYGEFYHGDSYTLAGGGFSGSGSNHDEILLGTMAQLPGAPDVVSAVWDPIPNVTTPAIETHDGGFRWLNNTTGAFAKSYRIFAGSTTAGDDNFFGKAAGLGEVEFMSDPAPIEIGNRIWRDTNGNGIQDPDEAIISGVTVQLWADTNADNTVDTQVGTAVTDANGNYYFGGLSNNNMSGVAACSNTITSRVFSSTDDAEQSGTTMNLAGTSLDLAYTGAAVNIAGLRFNNLTIPQGATITSARIQFTTQTVTNASTVNLTIQGENVDNAATFTAAASNISSRANTAASVNWNAVAGWGIAGQAGANQLSPNLSTVLQEIVNRPGWVNGNSANFIIRNNASTASATRSAQSFDTNSANAPILIVTYQCKYAVNANTRYEVRVATGQAALTATPALTTANADSSANADSRDSDATLVGANAVITIITGTTGVSTHTLDMGFLPSASAIYSIGNRVFYDTNNNGQRDGTEVGIAGVTVDLLNSAGTQINTQTTSSVTNIGYYRFDNLVAGTYRLRIRASNFTGAGVLVGYQNSTSATIGTDQRDNGTDPAANNPSALGVVTADIVIGDGVIPTSEPDFVGVPGSSVAAHATIGDGRDNLTVDFGFYSMVLGNLIFIDANSNGTFDGIDSPLGGAAVKLYQSNGTTEVAVGPDGILGTTDDTTGGTNQMTTGSNGLYQFSGLTPASYVVKVTPGSGYRSTTDIANTGNPNSNTDSDDNGIGSGTGQISSAVNASAITLTPGSEPTVNNATGRTTNSTLDFGVNSVTAVKFANCVVSAYDSGTLIEWQTGYEVDNLGFTLYRDENGRRVAVNQQMIAGSALKAGAGTVISSGLSYAWWDASAQSKTAAYWLEAFDLSGTSEWFGPFFGKQIGGPAPASSNATLLNRLGQMQEPVTRVVEAMANMPKTLPKVPDTRLVTAEALVAMKISVKDEGWYRISPDDLLRAGFPASTDPQLLQLYVDGKELPIIVTNEKEGTAVEFYGMCVSSPYTAMRTYYLIAGTRAGLRVNEVKGNGGTNSAKGFAQTVERRDRTIYFSSLRNGEAENFFGAILSGNPLDQAINLTQVDVTAQGDATLEVSLQGVTLVNHNILVQWNGASLGYLTFAGQSLGSTQFRVPHSMLSEGQNRVTLIPLGGASDVTLVEAIRVTYQHRYKAENNTLNFKANGGQQVNLEGFSNKAIQVIEVTNPQKPCQIAIDIVASQPGGYAVRFAAPESGERKFLAFTNDKKKMPPVMQMEEPSNWKQTDNMADFVIITAKEFAPALETLKVLRESQGLMVAIVDVEDIYDEFSYGQKTPQAIKDFLTFTTKWSKVPRFALFAGDASFDPKNYLGAGNFDFVPTKLIDTNYMETSSDDWLADFNNDGFTEMCIGRLPVRTVEGAQLLMGKIIRYGTSTPSQEVLLVADTPDIFNFEESIDTLQTIVGSQAQVGQIKRGRLDAETARRQLLEALNRGQKLVNYSGHGSVTLWRGNLLTNADASLLTNQQLSVVVLMTCLNGYFQDMTLDSLAESLLRAENGGAVAVWASSGLTEPFSQAVMNQELYRQLFNSNIRNGTLTIGEAVKRAKMATNDSETRRTWILFGDPTMKLK